MFGTFALIYLTETPVDGWPAPVMDDVASQEMAAQTHQPIAIVKSVRERDSHGNWVQSDWSSLGVSSLRGSWRLVNESALSWPGEVP